VRLVNQAQRITALQQVPLLCCLTRPVVGELARRTEEVKVAKGAFLYREGDGSGEVYVVLDGSLVVRRDRREIATPKKGDFLGEMSLIDGMPHSADVVAQEDSVVLVVHRRDFEELLEIPQVSRTVMQELTSRLRETDDKHLD